MSPLPVHGLGSRPPPIVARQLPSFLRPNPRRQGGPFPTASLVTAPSFRQGAVSQRVPGLQRMKHTVVTYGGPGWTGIADRAAGRGSQNPLPRGRDGLCPWEHRPGSQSRAGRWLALGLDVIAGSALPATMITLFAFEIRAAVRMHMRSLADLWRASAILEGGRTYGIIRHTHC